MKCAWFTLLLLAMTGALTAQQPLISPETPVTPNILYQWLHSGDPHLIAWAADFARRSHDTKTIAEMPSLLEHWTIPPVYDGDESQVSQGRAVMTVLDTLIQENVQVPIPAIKVVAQFFPSQAIILISRLPLSESRATLEDWTYGATGTWSGRVLARVAAMMLAKEPESTFVASIVAASEEDLQISIRSDDSEQNTGTGSACGDSFGHKTSPGWPQVYTYDLVENDSDSGASLVIDLDGDRIFFRRFEENLGWGSCFGVAWLNPVTRHRLIAHWLEVKDENMRWKPKEHFSIVWTTRTAYEKQLGILVESQRENLQATVEALHGRGLLTESQVATTVPRLVVTIRCDMKPCPLTK